MPALSFYMQTGADGNFSAMTEVEAATRNNRTDGWTVGKVATAFSAEYDSGTKQATGAFTAQGTTAKPASFLTGVTANAFKSANTYAGSFAAAAWTFQFGIRATVVSTQTGRIRFRVFTSRNADGSSATERTGATQVTSTSGVLSTTTVNIVSVNWTPGAIFSLVNEFIFVVMAWETVAAGGSNTADVVLVSPGTGSSDAANVITSTFTVIPTISLVKEHPNRRIMHRRVAANYDRW